jgi:multiple antibiotic resistance protein
VYPPPPDLRLDDRRRPPVPRDAVPRGSILPIVNPLAGAPVFLVKTSDLTPEERRTVAMRVARYGYALLLASAFVGAYVLDFFGVSIPVVQVAGGLVVSALGWTSSGRRT